MNQVNLIGNLTKDVEIRATNGGTTVGRLRLAIQRPRRNGEDRGADYVDVVVFDTQAQNCAKYLAKGRKVAVTGRLSHSEWDTDDGQRRQKLEVIASNVEFLGRGATDPNTQPARKSPRSPTRRRPSRPAGEGPPNRGPLATPSARTSTVSDHPTIHPLHQHADATLSGALQARCKQGRRLRERSIELAAAIGDH